MIFERLKGRSSTLQPQTFTSPKVSQNPNNSESYRPAVAVDSTGGTTGETGPKKRPGCTRAGEGGTLGGQPLSLRSFRLPDREERMMGAKIADEWPHHSVAQPHILWVMKPNIKM